MISMGSKPMEEPDFYDIYQEARHKPMSELKREWGIIKHDLETNPFLTDEERLKLEYRLKDIEEMMEIRVADEQDARWKRLQKQRRQKPL